MGPRTRRGILVTALGLAALLVFGLGTPVADTSRADASLTPRAVLAPTPGDQLSPAVASNGSEFLVVWEDRRNGIDETDIYASRVAADGTTLDPDGIAIATADGLEWTPEVASDGTNFLVVWTDGVQGNRGDVRAARVTPQGEVLDPGGFVLTAPRAVRRVSPARGLRRPELPRHLRELLLHSRHSRRAGRHDPRSRRVRDLERVRQPEKRRLLR